MDKHGFDVYHRLKDLDNSNIVDVMDCFLHEDKCVAVEEFVNGKRLCDVLQKNIPVEVIVDYVKADLQRLKRSPQQKYCTQGFATEKYNCGQTQSYYNH